MIVAPSVLSLDYSKVNVQMEALNASQAKWIHYDVMDGHFVPNLSFGPDVLKGLKKLSNLFFDVHIMVSDPKFFAPIFIDAGAEALTFHYETLDHEGIVELIKYIQSRNVKAGISIKPNTDVHVLDDLLPLVDLVLIMSVEPGFGGQKFDDRATLKLDYLKKVKEEKGLDFIIEVDGGVNNQTIDKVQSADVVVSGSYIFKGDIVKNVESLL